MGAEAQRIRPLYPSVHIRHGQLSWREGERDVPVSHHNITGWRVLQRGYESSAPCNVRRIRPCRARRSWRGKDPGQLRGLHPSGRGGEKTRFYAGALA